MSALRSPHLLAQRVFIALLGVVALGTAALTASGCTTDAYCFGNCEADKIKSETGSGTGTGGTGGGTFAGSGGQGGGCIFNCQGGGTNNCVPTADPTEVCDGVDNDCDGQVDNVPADKLTTAQHCGTCANNCLNTVPNCGVDSVTCTPSSTPGSPGTCGCAQCAQDYYTVDPSKPCAYYCVKTGLSEDFCNNVDDNCNGQKDEGVDLCTSVTDCGFCGHNCSLPHATAKCVNTGGPPCTAQNTQCEIQKCDCNGPGDCWWDRDGVASNGCEYQCDQTNGGVEVCDGLDNDCDGKIDAADDLSGDPKVGQVCFGSPYGICATVAHAGTTTCVGGQVVCSGANVLHPNDQLEVCNGLDDDCDGTVDDNPTDVGGACGTSNVFPCSFGSYQCINGQKQCIGAVNPKPEVCNGIDDNCDGFIDATGTMPPADSVGPCNVPKPPPPGLTSPCKAGALACVGGVVECLGAVGPTSTTDTCGVDANCDGIAENQPNLLTDVHNCGSCGHDCYAGAVHSIWSCVNGACQFGGCETGYWDLPPIDHICSYACTFVSSQESCNGIDDNCNGQIDENVNTPSPVQVCGVSPSATAPECTTGVGVACQNGSWKCTFPAGVCNPTCATTTEVCDTLDNNCNGVVNENVPNYGKPCASDDGKPPPGDGACRTTGTYVCSGTNSTVCSAVKADCSTLPGGCTELCDGIDNDCDGLIDETFANKGSNATYFVKPAATKVGTSLWIYSFEASRPSSTAQSPGSGNGYWTSAPAGTTLDKTPSCSVQGRIPWFNVTPAEAEQVCQAMAPSGVGHLCTLLDWQTACHATIPCKWGYAPRGTSCTSTYTTSKYCNLGPFDFNTSVTGDQDGLLVTGSSLLQNCWADWSGLNGNTTTTGKIFDMTGNLREITHNTGVYTVMGGAFNTADPNGATCDFTFYDVDSAFEFYDTGFRCCFSQDPTL